MVETLILIFIIISILNLMLVANIYKLITKIEREQYRLCGTVINIQKDRFQQMIKPRKIMKL